MKKLFVLSLVLVIAVLFTACGSEENVNNNSEVYVQVTSKPDKENSNTDVVIAEEYVEKPTRNAAETDPTEESTKSKKKKTKKLPTQGETQAGTYIPVTTAPAGSFSKSDLRFIFEGAYIDLNDDIDDALAILGEDNAVTELSKTKTEYEYDSFVLTTYDSNKTERIELITITTDVFPTTKEARVGMYATQLRKLYGDPTQKTDTAYIYTIGNKSLVFNHQNNIITSYCYRLNH